jgi:ribonuclease Z
VLRTAVAACSLLGLAAVAGTGQPSPIVVTLLGTGTPDPRIDRFGPSTVVQAGGKVLLFDVGRGATIRLQQIGLSAGRLTGVFISHLHSDHTSGLPDLWLTGWLPPHGARRAPLRIWGPQGTRSMTDHLTEAYRADQQIRIADEKLPREGAVMLSTEFAGETVVLDEDGVRVTAFLVDHGRNVGPAYGYKVEYVGHSVVISGDTRYCPNLVEHARGADLLLHEVASAPADIQSLPQIRAILAHHTSPADAGRVFAQSAPRLAVFTHLVLLATAKGERPTPEDVAAEARKTYAGPLVVGEDLMQFVLDAVVEVRRFDAIKQGY